MANTLRFKRGLASGIPTAVAGEPLFTTDTFDLYIGNGTTNTRFQKYIASGTTSQLLRGDGSLLTMPIVLTSPANGEVLKYNGTNWVNSSDAGITGSGAAGQVAYFTGATTQAGSNNLFWDNTNGRLGIGTNTPTQRLQVAVTSALTTAIFTNTGTDGGIDIHNTGTLANVRTAQLRLVNGSTFFGANDRGYQLVNYGRSSTVADFYVQYYNGTSYFDRFRIFGSTGNFGINTGFTDSGQRLQVVGTGYFSDSVGIGATSLTGYNLLVSKNLTGSNAPIGIASFGAIQNDATNIVRYFSTSASSQAATFTTSNLVHYQAIQSSFGAGHTVTNQYGFAVSSSLINGTNNYGFHGDIASGTNRWNLYMQGTADNYFAGNLGIGVATPSAKIDLASNYYVGSATTLQQLINKIAIWSSGGIPYYGLGSDNDGMHITSGQATVGNITFHTGGTAARMRLAASGNLLIGSTTDSGEKLQVTGTMKVTGASTFNTSINVTSGAAANGIFLNSAGTTSLTRLQMGTAVTIFSNNFNAFSPASQDNTAIPSWQIRFGGGAGADFYRIERSPAGSTTMGTLLNIDGSGNTTLAGNLTVDTNTLFVDATNNRVGVNMTPSYALDVTGSARISDAIAIGTTPDTNNPFKILKNINSTVGIRFENTNTSSAAFSAVQLGTDITGGTKFTNLVYSSSGVVATGVYNPDGTSLINNGSGGLNFLGTPFRIYTGTGNGTLRILFDNEGTTQINATTPTTNAVDGYKQYSADVTAGNAAPHFRTENGAVIKLYQETTGVGNAIFSAGGGNSVLDDSTFDGYTLRQIVKALRNQGILA